MKAQIEAQNLERKTEAEAVATKVDGKSVILVRQAGETGQLYGSVSTRDIADALTKDGVSVERRQIVLNSPIKTIGLHVLPVALHPEVEVKITVNVARTPDEAERQARGEDLSVARSDEQEARAEAKIEAEKFFEETPEELKAEGEKTEDGDAEPAKG
jgi:large subunit ribosomal protein L9